MADAKRCTMTEPEGELVIRTVPLPAQTNPNGDIFGGWLVSQMDLGGGIAARERSKKRVTTVAIEEMRFWHPVRVGDTLCCYAKLVKIGRSSMRYHLSAWVLPQGTGKRACVTEAFFTYVAIDEKGRPTPVEPA